MGWLIYPDLKELYCEGPCKHVDCIEAKRRYKDKTCPICKKALVPGDRFYERDGQPIHAGCIRTDQENTNTNTEASS